MVHYHLFQVQEILFFIWSYSKLQTEHYTSSLFFTRTAQNSTCTLGSIHSSVSFYHFPKFAFKNSSLFSMSKWNLLSPIIYIHFFQKISGLFNFIRWTQFFFYIWHWHFIGFLSFLPCFLASFFPSLVHLTAYFKANFPFLILSCIHSTSVIQYTPSKCHGIVWCQSSKEIGFRYKSNRIVSNYYPCSL